jgi:hypothetical protein
MTTGGWIFMLVSLGFVWTLAIWCYYVLLTTKPPIQEDESHR